MQFDDHTRDLVNLHLWEGAVQKQFDLDHLFGYETDRTISFEVVFTAFLATIVLGAPPTETVLDALIPWVAGGLLLTTLVRRMALDNVFVDEDQVIRGTLVAIFALTIFAVLYLSLSLGGLLSELFGFDVYLTSAVMLIVASYGFVFGYEIIFNDFLFWGAVSFYNEAFDESEELSTDFRITMLMLSRFLLKFSFADYNEEHYAIRRIRKIDLGDSRRVGSVGMVVFYAISLGIIFVILAVFTLPLVWVLETSLFIGAVISGTLAASFLAIVTLTDFVYGRYGSADINLKFTGPSDLKMILLLYFVILLHGGLINTLAQLL